MERLIRGGPEVDAGLLALGYYFDDEGVLRQTQTRERFAFVDQKHYDAVGEQVAVAIQRRLVVNARLREVPLLPDAALTSSQQRQSSIWVSDDLASNDSVVLVLIHGSGAVRGGQWARSLCMNDSLHTGSMLPYVYEAQLRGWAVVICDGNVSDLAATAAGGTGAAAGDGGATGAGGDHGGSSDGDEDGAGTASRAKRAKKLAAIPGSETPRKHVVSVYDHYVRASPAKHMLVVAHSAGGYAVVSLALERPSVQSRIRAVAFTDSAHKLAKIKGARSTPSLRSFLRSRTRNWVRSDQSLDRPLPDKEGVPCVSAGHAKHEYTSASALRSVFRYFDTALQS